MIELVYVLFLSWMAANMVSLLIILYAMKRFPRHPIFYEPQSEGRLSKLVNTIIGFVTTAFFLPILVAGEWFEDVYTSEWVQEDFLDDADGGEA